MEHKKKIFSYILSFVFTLFLGMFLISSGIYLGFGYVGSAQSAFVESEGVDAVRERILDTIDYSNVPYGMDRLVFERIITHDIVHEDVKAYIASKYSGSEFINDKGKLEKDYYFFTNQLLSEKGIAITDQGDRAISEYFNRFNEHYNYWVKFDGINVFEKLAQDYNSAIIWTICGSIALALGAGILLYFNRDSRAKMLVYGILGGGIMAVLPPAYMLFSQDYLRFTATSQMNYDFNVVFIRNGLVNIGALGVIALIIGVGVLICTYLRRDKDKLLFSK